MGKNLLPNDTITITDSTGTDNITIADGSTTGTLSHSHGGLTFDPNSTTDISSDGLTYSPMSEEDEAERAKLQEQRAMEIKQLKTDAFKALSTHIREGIVNQTLAQEECVKISQLEVPESDREKELSRNKLTFGNTHIPRVPPIEGLSLEDLQAAHAQKCLEEAINE